MNESWRGDRRYKSSRRGGERHGRFDENTRGQTRNFRAVNNETNHQNSGYGAGEHGGNYKKTGKEPEKSNGYLSFRSKWVSTPICPYCNEPIKDLFSALTDRNGEAVHFECAQKRVAAMERLESGDKVTYIGGGRFGIVAFENPSILKKFKIKKIIEWEQKDKRADWRSHIADHFSLT
jgi:hypothetical protein